MHIRISVGLAAAMLIASSAFGQVPGAIAADPPRDREHPARMGVLHIPSGGEIINGVAYLAADAGPHPTFILFHGLPGNEKNLDLAQAVRRAGWNAVTVNYRGSWAARGRSASAVTSRMRKRCSHSCATPRTRGDSASIRNASWWLATVWAAG